MIFDQNILIFLLLFQENIHQFSIQNLGMWNYGNYKAIIETILIKRSHSLDGSKQLNWKYVDMYTYEYLKVKGLLKEIKIKY